MFANGSTLGAPLPDSARQFAFVKFLRQILLRQFPAMGIETDFARLIDSAPKVECAHCIVEMTLRTLAAQARNAGIHSHFSLPKVRNGIPSAKFSVQAS